ncbi:MAG: GreA/GreB family elongation factor [Anaerolineales bacterium]
MSTNFLTREGFNKLQGELEYLCNKKRKEVAERLHSTIEESNRLSEDPEYEAVKNEQAFVEGRIRELKMLLAQARIIEGGVRDVAQVGATVTIQEDGAPADVYMIVGAVEANPREGLISNVSPLGKALLNHRAGDAVSVEAPSGPFTVKILDVK